MVGDGVGELDGDGSGSARRPLREARSSPVRLAAALDGAALAPSAVGVGVSVAGPRFIAATEAPRTTPARVSEAMSGTYRRGRNWAMLAIRVEKPRGAGRESACLPDKIEPFVGDRPRVTLSAAVPDPSS